MNIQLYLERIKYDGNVTASLDVLSKLQVLHLMNVPFENLDIQHQIKIDLDNLFDKIITRKRGGFCYELNGMFYKLLKQIGFVVKMVSARVYNNITKNYSPEFDHMALIVSFDKDDYLVDVEFGEFTLCPIKIEPGAEAEDPGGIFRIDRYDNKYFVVKKKNEDGEFIAEYNFTKKERKIKEFYPRCNYHQVNKESHFTQKRICSLPTERGRLTLTGTTLKITEKGIVKETKLNDEMEVQQVLWSYFGIKL